MENAKLISEWFIRPKCEDSHSKKQQQPHYYYLSPPDFFRISASNAHHGLLFTKPHSTSINSSFFGKLNVTLAFALNHFYPLAGRFVTKRYVDEHSCRIIVDCNKGPGARLIHAAAPKINVRDTLAPNADVPLFVQSFFDLGERAINYDGHTRPLLTIQVTELVDGVFMGFTTNHCVLDGTSFYHFFHVWSEIFSRYRSKNNHVIIPLSRLPIYQRPPVPNVYGPTIKLPYLDPHEFITQTINGHGSAIRERTFHFSVATMAMLKAKANVECNNNNHTISSFQALSALVWRSITRARNLPLEDDTTCVFDVNIRPRFDPPLSYNYFGNYLTVTKGTAKVGELLKNSLGWAAMLLHQSIMDVDNEAARDAFLRPYIEGRPTLMSLGYVASFGPNPVVMAGSNKFEPYAVQFGLGRAVAVRTGNCNGTDGKVMTYPTREGGGNVELTIRLMAHTMEVLLSDEELLNSVSLSPKL